MVPPIVDIRGAYRDFWGQVLASLRDKAPLWTDWTNRKAPGEHWIALRSGRSGITYGVNFRRSSRKRCVQLALSPKAPELAEGKAYRRLERQRPEIEALFGARLTWEPLEHRIESRIAIYRDGDIEDIDQWSEYRSWFAETVIRLRIALHPFVNAL